MNETEDVEQWGWGRSPEVIGESHFDTREEALDAATESEGPGETVYLSKIEQPDAKDYLMDPRQVVEDMGDRAYDDRPSWLDSEWPQVSQEALDELGALMRAWVDKHISPDWFNGYATEAVITPGEEEQ